MHKVYIIIGKESVEYFESERYDYIDYDKVLELSFNTIDEKIAFCKGVQYTGDYDNYTFIDKDEYNKINNYINSNNHAYNI